MFHCTIITDGQGGGGYVNWAVQKTVSYLQNETWTLNLYSFVFSPRLISGYENLAPVVLRVRNICKWPPLFLLQRLVESYFHFFFYLTDINQRYKPISSKLFQWSGLIFISQNTAMKHKHRTLDVSENFQQVVIFFFWIEINSRS